MGDLTDNKNAELVSLIKNTEGNLVIPKPGRITSKKMVNDWVKIDIKVILKE